MTGLSDDGATGTASPGNSRGQTVLSPWPGASPVPWTVEETKSSPAVPRPRPPRPGIPTSDPAAALIFCRQMAEFLTPAPRRPAPVLSVVIPVHNEEGNLPVLYGRLVAALEAAEPSFEIIFVDDGSRDGSLRVMAELAERDERLAVVELARNFGHQIAISAGLDQAAGQATIVMDADLQDPPEVLPQFITAWRAGHDVVYAIREKRKEAWPKRAAYAAFYRVLQRVANIEIPLDAGDFCIMDRRVVDVLNSMPERNRFVRGIRSWIGLDQVGLAYERHARYAGESSYSLRRLVYLALDGLVSFSYVPLRVITLLGSAVSAMSLVLALFYGVKKLTYGLNPPGFATLTVAIFFLAGIQLLTIGVIGEYVGRIFEEVKHRPLYVARQIIRGGQP